MTTLGRALIFHGDARHGAIDAADIHSAFLEAPDTNIERDHYRVDYMVVGQVEGLAVHEEDGSVGRDTVYCSVLDRRLGGYPDEKSAREAVAFVAARMLVEYHARERLPWALRWVMPFLFRTMAKRGPA